MTTTETNLDFPKLTAERLDHYRHAPTGAVDFIEDQCVCKNALDGGRSWVRPKLTELQRQTVLGILSREDPPHTALISWPRKLGKTWLSACIVTYKICCHANELALVAGPTRDSARELGYTAIVDNFTHNRSLYRAVGADIQKGRILIKATSSEVRAVSRTLGSQAGSDWTIAAIDELWAWTDRALVEHYRSLTTPSPTRQNPLVLVTSYAPIKGRSTLLESLIRRAKRRESGLFASIVTGANQTVAVCPWVTKQFLRQMKATQPPGVFRRVFLNKATRDTDEQDRYMFSRKQVAECVDATWGRQLARPADLRGVTIIGLDFGSKHDAAVAACLARLKDQIALLDLAVKHGTKAEPLPASWVLDTVLDMVARFGHCKVMCDPLGLADVIAALRARGFEVVELNRKGPEIADRLYRAIAGRRLKLYPKAGLVTTFDGREYSLEDELCNLMLDAETYKIGHFGEATQPGRHWDDRCTGIGLALQAPELELANTAAMQGVANIAEFFGSQADRSMGGRQRVFNGQPIRPGATFAPRGPGPVRIHDRT